MLQHAENLLKQVLLFEHPTDVITSRYFKENRQLGVRDRAVLADTIYKVIREKSFLEHLAQSNGAPIKEKFEKRLAILGWQGDQDWLQYKLSAAERQWLVASQQVDFKGGPEHIRYSLPQWLIEPLKAQLGDEFDAFALSMLQNAPLDLRVNALKSKREQAQKLLATFEIETQPTPYSFLGLRVQGKPALSKHPLFLDGSIEVQDEGSQLLALLVGAKRNEIVIDYCAGAGGKTLVLGAAMRNTGRVYAWDVAAHRLDALKPRLARSGLTNVFTAAITHGQDERVKRLHGKADRVLVDVPCSGLGTLRRSPDLKWRQTPEKIQELMQTQSSILGAASKLVKEGGLLVYATCSILQDESEHMAQQFSKQQPKFKAVDMLQLLEVQKIKDAQALVQNGYLRLWPHRHQTDGFFAAAWQRQ